MIVAGIGCRTGSSPAVILDIIRRALGAQGLTLEAVGKLATGEIKQNDRAIKTAAEELNVPLEIVDDDALDAVKHRCLTQSPKSIEVTGAASLSEAAALAAAGEASRLMAPRTAGNGVTCALAWSEAAL